ncbi:hypothetical protein HDV57DRAFT_496612, partial [Trichoderma longibrachiatum]
MGRIGPSKKERTTSVATAAIDSVRLLLRLQLFVFVLTAGWAPKAWQLVSTVITGLIAALYPEISALRYIV